MPGPDPNIVRRGVFAVSWQMMANLMVAAVGVARMVLLTRWVPAEAFGVYAFAGAIVGVSVMVPVFGMGGAFLHPCPETHDEANAAAVHFTLKLAFTLPWAAVLMGGAWAFAQGPHRTALMTLTLASAGIQLTQTPRLVLIRRVIHRRLALLHLLNGVCATVIALVLARMGAGLWALLATDLSTLALSLFLLYVWRPVWRPRLVGVRPEMRYFLRFGSRMFFTDMVREIMNRMDVLWAGVFLGETATGYYSRAQRLAAYPLTLLFAPIYGVTPGVFAGLRDNAPGLGLALAGTIWFLTRVGLFFSGLMMAGADQWAPLMLGDEWTPIVPVLRLMPAFYVLMPVNLVGDSLLTALGRPETALCIRLVQLTALGAGLAVLGPGWSISGVAMSVNLMLVIGAFLFFRQAARHAPISPARLFSPPVGALAAGLMGAAGCDHLMQTLPSPLTALLSRMITFSLIFWLTLGIVERKRLLGFVKTWRKNQSIKTD